MLKLPLIVPSLLVLLSIPCLIGFGRVDSISEEDNHAIQTVVIDPGHGGKDPGAMGANSIEKEIALSVALRLGAQIETYHPEVRVIYTRDTDVFIGLSERADIANRNHADVFISIHCNSVRNKSHVKGLETFVLGIDGEISDVAKRENEVIYMEDEFERTYGIDPNTPQGMIRFGLYQDANLHQSILLAGHIQKQAKEYGGRRTRLVKQDKFVVLRLTNMPAVLVEIGFLSNEEEEAYLNSIEGQETMAASLYHAFLGYKNEVEGIVILEEERE